MDLKDLLSKIAPTVASAVLGPMGGVAVSAISDILGLASTPTVAKINEALKAGQLTPEQITQLKELDLKLKNEEAERGFKYAELEFKDLDSARIRDGLFIAAGTRNYRADALALVAVLAVIALTIAIWRDPTINEYMKGTVTLVLGRFLGYIDQIYGFEFGTTRNSQKKTDIIAQSDAIK